MYLLCRERKIKCICYVEEHLNVIRGLDVEQFDINWYLTPHNLVTSILLTITLYMDHFSVHTRNYFKFWIELIHWHK